MDITPNVSGLTPHRARDHPSGVVANEFVVQEFTAECALIGVGSIAIMSDEARGNCRVGRRRKRAQSELERDSHGERSHGA